MWCCWLVSLARHLRRFTATHKTGVDMNVSQQVSSTYNAPTHFTSWRLQS